MKNTVLCIALALILGLTTVTAFADNQTSFTLNPNSQNLLHPDSLTLETANDTVNVTPTTSLAVGNLPYSQNTTTYINPLQDGSDSNERIVLDRQYQVAGDVDLPYYTEMLTFNKPGSSYTVLDHLLGDDLKSQNTLIKSRVENMFIPLRPTGSGTMHIHTESDPFYVLQYPLSNPGQIRVDYSFRTVSFNEKGVASYQTVYYRVQIPSVDGLFYVPAFPALDSYNPESTFQTYTPQFSVDGEPIITDEQISVILRNFGTQLVPSQSTTYYMAQYQNFETIIYYSSGQKLASNPEMDFIFQLRSQTSMSNSNYGSRAYFADEYYERLAIQLGEREVDTGSWFDWISETLDGFLGIEIMPNFTLGTVAFIFIAAAVVLALLKLFAGG